MRDREGFSGGRGGEEEHNKYHTTINQAFIFAKFYDRRIIDLMLFICFEYFKTRRDIG